MEFNEARVYLRVIGFKVFFHKNPDLAEFAAAEQLHLGAAAGGAARALRGAERGADEDF